MVDDSIDDQVTVARDRVVTPRTQTETSDGSPPLIDTANAGLQVVEFDARYPKERELGRGGMGTVDLCHDRQIGRHVAMKVINAQYQRSATVLARFIREARVQAQLEHPAVVPVYELGRDPAGHAYFTMKRIRGMTLREIVNQLRDGDPLAIDLYTRRKLLSDFSRVCLALDFAHRTGVVHRDIKPANIMLGEYGEVYVLDWGIAKTNDDKPVNEATRVGRALGTPGYMAPEQIHAAGSVAPAADVYALGCVLFELLTHRHAHGGPTAESRLESTLHAPVRAPSEVQPGAGIAPELDVMCLRATAMSPHHRYTARELHTALEQFLDGERDLALRQSAARTHAEHARETVELLRAGASENPEGDRRAALREVGQALALDPTNRVATTAMVELLTRPPDVVPDEVAGRLELRRQGRHQTGARVAAGFYLSTLLYFPLLWWAGILDPGPVFGFFALIGVAALVSVYVAVKSGPRRPLVLAAMFASTAAISTTAAFFGPLVLMPAVLATNAAAFALTLDAAGRRLTVVAGIAAVAVPVILEVTHVVSPSLAPGPDGLTILPRALSLDGAPAVVLLGIASLGAIVTGVLAVGRVRDALSRAEGQLELYNWHFRQLLPDPEPPRSSRPGT